MSGPSPQNITYHLKIKHILIVEDDTGLAEAWKMFLESNDFVVSTFSNGVEALKLIMEMDVDAIICDLMMPQMAGDMFYLAIERVKPQLCRRFIFVTGYDKFPKFEAFLKKVNPVILYKPITPGKLLGTIKVLFSKAAAASSAASDNPRFEQGHLPRTNGR